MADLNVSSWKYLDQPYVPILNFDESPCIEMVCNTFQSSEMLKFGLHIT